MEYSELKIRWLRFACVFVLIACFLVAYEDAVNAKSRTRPVTSAKMTGKSSRFSLEDPRVALDKITETKSAKEPEEKNLPKGVAGSPYSAEEQEALNMVEDLRKAYIENKHRPDGYGVEITKEIVTALGAIKSRRSVKFLTNLLESNEENVELKEDMVESLRQIGDKKAVDALKKHLEYLNAKKPNDPLAGHTWQGWIDKTQSAITELDGK